MQILEPPLALCCGRRPIVSWRSKMRALRFGTRAQMIAIGQYVFDNGRIAPADQYSHTQTFPRPQFERQVVAEAVERHGCGRRAEKFMKHLHPGFLDGRSVQTGGAEKGSLLIRHADSILRV